MCFRFGTQVYLEIQGVSPGSHLTTTYRKKIRVPLFQLSINSLRRAPSGTSTGMLRGWRMAPYIVVRVGVQYEVYDPLPRRQILGCFE